jgi:hypothetical protein
MKRTKGALRALSPKRTRERGGSFDDTNAPASSFTSPGGQRHSGRGRFSLRKPRPYQDLPEPVQSEEDFLKEWGLPRSVEVRRRTGEPRRGSGRSAGAGPGTDAARRQLAGCPAAYGRPHPTSACLPGLRRRSG